MSTQRTLTKSTQAAVPAPKKSFQRTRALLWPVLIFVFCISLTFNFSFKEQHELDSVLQQRLDFEASAAKTSMLYHLEMQAEMMRGLKGFFAASNEVTREEFRAYFQSLGLPQIDDVSDQRAGFVALAYHEWVKAKALPQHLAKMRKHGFTSYQIKPAGVRDFYAPMVFIEPFIDNNRDVLGFDPLTVPAERAAIERARDAEMVSISGKLTLTQDQDKALPSLGFVMYAPLYRVGSLHQTLADRRAHFLGWIDASFRMTQFIKDVFPNGLQNIDFEIYEGNQLVPESRFLNKPVATQPHHNAESALKSVQTLAFGGQTWTLVFTAQPDYGGYEAREQTELFFSMGILVSLLLSFIAAFVLQFRRRHAVMTLLNAELQKKEELAAQQAIHNRALRDGEAAARLAMESANAALAQLKVQKFALDQHLIFSATNVQGLITLVNEKFCRISGYSRTELIGKDHHLMNSGTHPKGYWKEMYELIAQGAIWQGEVCNRSRSGELYWLANTVVPFMGDNGKPEQYIAMSTDITAQKKAEILLRDSEFRWKVAIEGSGYGLWDWNLQDNLVYFSESWKAIFAISPTQNTDGLEEWDRRLQPKYLQPTWEALRLHLAGKTEKFSAEYQAKTNQGETKWIIDQAMVVSRDAEGKPLRVIGTIQDITERKNNELALLESQRIAHLGSWTLDIGSGRMVWSEEVYRIFELDPAQFSPTYDHLLEAIHPEDKEVINAVYIQSLGDKKPYAVTHRLRMSNGSIKWVEQRGTTEFDAVGTPLLTRGTMQNITEQKLAELDLQAYRKQLEEMVQQQTAHLHEAQEKLVLITNSVPGAVYQYFRTVAGEWKVAYISKGVEELFELTAQEVYEDQTKLSSCILPEDIPAWQHSIERCYAELSDWVLEYRICTPSHKIKWLRGQSTIKLLSDGAVMWNGILTDITERKLIEDAALMANRAKSEFLANMSHEIRTPMNGVIGIVDILQQTTLTAAQQRMLRTINDSSQSLLSILNDILDYSKIEAGKLTIEAIPTQLREVAESVVQLMSSIAQDKGIELTLFTASDLPTWVSSDPTRLRQIMLNLLGNALKFTRSQDTKTAQVELRVECCEHIQGGNGVQLRILDNGIGMSQEVIAKLFQPFTQADESTARKFGGTGLGLSITQRLVAMMDGEIEVHSALSQGSEFVVKLPLMPCAPGELLAQIDHAGAQVKQVLPTVAEAAAQRRLILVAEDNETNREVMQEQLRLLGYTAEFAEDGEIALARWRSGCYALLLSDCHMPNMDGFELTAAIRQSENGQSRMPIIAVTANAMQGEAERCTQRGMDDYLSKPLRLNELAAMLKKWLPEQTVAQPSAVLADLEISVPVQNVAESALWDKNILLHLIGDNPAMCQRLLRKFLPNSAQQVASIVAAVAAGDLTQVVDLNHKLKSAARSVGAMQLGETSEALERAAKLGEQIECETLAAQLQPLFEQTEAAIQQELTSEVNSSGLA